MFHIVSILDSVKCELLCYYVSNCHIVSILDSVKSELLSHIVSILDSVKSELLSFDNQTLSSEETRALVRAMESGVEEVVLGDRGEVSLDITTLTQYSGQGKCVEVNCYNYTTANTYWEEAKTWARRIDWMFRDLNGQPFFFTLFKYIPV